MRIRKEGRATKFNGLHKGEVRRSIFLFAVSKHIRLLA